MKLRHGISTALGALIVLGSVAPGARAAGPETRPRVRTESSEAGSQGWLGVYLEAMTPLTRSALGLAENDGVLVGGTVKGSGAEQAGLARGDVLLKVDGQPVASDNDVHEALQGKAGKDIKLDILRAGKPLAITAHAGDRFRDSTDMDKTAPDMESPREPDGEDGGDMPPRDITVIMGGSAWLGVEPQDLGKELSDAFGVPDSKGVLIARVLPGSPAAKAGLKAGDVLVALDGKKLEDSGDLRRALKEIRSKRSIELKAVRKGQPLKLMADVAPRSDWRVGPVNLPDMGQFHWQFTEKDRAQLQSEMRRLRQEMDDLKLEIRKLAERHNNR